MKNLITATRFIIIIFAFHYSIYILFNFSLFAYLINNNRYVQALVAFIVGSSAFIAILKKE